MSQQVSEYPRAARTGNEWYRWKRQQLIEEFGGMCEFCQSKENLEFAHVLPTEVTGLGRGRNRRILDIMQNPEAYKLLCQQCHLTFDRTHHIH